MTVREIVPTEDEAKREVDRLNRLAAAESAEIRYWYQITRFFSEGRGTS